MSIILLHMPYAAVERPSIGLGTLQACLQREGLESEVIYGNLLYAQRIGLKRYKLVELTPTDVFLGEWTFSSAAFPDFPGAGTRRHRSHPVRARETAAGFSGDARRYTRFYR